MSQKQKDEVAATTVFVSRSLSRFNKETKETIKSELPPKSEIISIQKFVVEPARVGTSYGLTVNLGAYESARVEVSLSLPCYVEETDLAYKYIKKWVGDRVEQEVEGLRKEAQDRAMEGIE